MSKGNGLYQVVMGGCVKEGGKTFHRYEIHGPEGEVMRGVRVGKKGEVRAHAQQFCYKLERFCKPSPFRAGKAA